MPLIHKEPVKLRSDPPEAALPGQEYFVIRFTGEKFIEYEDYIQQLEHYQQRIFQCHATGRLHLTYEEALASEALAAKKTAGYPESLLPALFQYVHHKTTPMNDLITEVMDLYRDNPVVGEEVKHTERLALITRVLPEDHPQKGRKLEIIYKAPKTKRRGDSSIAAALAKQSSKSSLDASAAPKDGDAMDVDEKPAAATTNEKVEVYAAEIMRLDRNKVSKVMLKSKIKESFTKGNYPKAPWIALPQYIAKYKLAKELPADIAEAEEKHLKKRKRSNNNNADDEDDSEMDALESKKSKTDFVKKNALDDLDVPRSGADANSLPPKPSTDFECPPHLLTPVFITWNFIVSFGRTLKVSPFSFEDFFEALQAPKEGNPLIAHAFVGMLRTIFRARERTKKIRKTSLNTSTWPTLLIQYLREEKYWFGHNHLLRKLKFDGYNALTLDERVAIFSYLVEKAHECSEILWAFEHLAGNKETIATELKERRAELKSTYALSVEETDAEFERIRDRMRPKDEETRIARYAELDEQKAAKLKEMEQAYQENGKSLTEEYERRKKILTRIRVTPLGYDRYHNRYWFFGGPAASHRLAVYNEKNSDLSKTIPSPTDTRVFVEFAPGNVQWQGGSVRLEEYFSDESIEDEEKTWPWDVVDDTVKLIEESDEEKNASSESSDYDEESEDEEAKRAVRRSMRAVPQSRPRPTYKDEADESFDEGADNGAADDDDGAGSADSDDDFGERRSGRIAKTQAEKKKQEAAKEAARRAQIGRPPARVSQRALRGQRSQEEEELAKALELSLKEEAKKEERAAKKNNKRQLSESEDLDASVSASAAAAPATATPAEQANNSTDSAAAPAEIKQEAAVDEKMDVVKPEPAATPAPDAATPANGDLEASASESGAAKSKSKSKSKSSSKSKEPKKEEKEDDDDDKMDVEGSSNTAALEIDYKIDRRLPPNRAWPESQQYLPKKMLTTWGYYETKEEIEKLVKFLDERGVREKKLKRALTAKLPKILNLIARRATLLKALEEENTSKRELRPGTMNAATKKTEFDFTTYKNKYAHLK